MNLLRIELTLEEKKLFHSLSTSRKIQDYLDSIPFNFEKQGSTTYAPRSVIREKKAHCLEGACFAAVALAFHGRKPLLLDLRSLACDYDHVVALFQENGYWGALSKTNHAVVRYRDPVYRTLRELALSFFHEYFLVSTGEKTLREYSRSFDLTRFSPDWFFRDAFIAEIAEQLDASKHFSLVPEENKKKLRRASSLERKAGALPEWRP